MPSMLQPCEGSGIQASRGEASRRAAGRQRRRRRSPAAGAVAEPGDWAAARRWPVLLLPGSSGLLERRPVDQREDLAAGLLQGLPADRAAIGRVPGVLGGQGRATGPAAVDRPWGT